VLFLDQWRQLRAVMRKAAARGQLGDRALEFLSFLSAGDALMAFDQAAPALGARISAADLRRLARVMAPQSTADPLQFNYREDPELQDIFGFTPPPETPDSVEPSDSDEAEPPAPAATGSTLEAGGATPQTTATPQPATSGATSTPATVAPPMSVASATPSASATPAEPSAPTPAASPARSSVAPSYKDELRTIMDAALHLLNLADAFAEAPPQPPDLKQLGMKLRRAVVNESNVGDYTRDLAALLEAAAASEIADEQPDPALQPIYRVMIKAAAWQESCWRQFVLMGSRVRFLESSSHDIGLMQVNRYVWRGFYNVRHLEWDIAYNAGAGSQILARLMVRGARKGAHANDPDAFARSSYAAYNGGPDEFNRWRRADEPHELLQIDEAFWQKYRALKQGQSLNILKCEAEWGHAPGH
jgi:hypothetical protein